jgi:hypothetical protein
LGLVGLVLVLERKVVGGRVEEMQVEFCWRVGKA